MDAGQAGTGDGQTARHSGTASQHNGAVVAAQVGGADIDSGLHPALEGRALSAHLVEPAVKAPLLHLELGDSVPEQAPGPVVPLEHGYRVPGPRQLLRGGQPGRT